MPNSDTSGDTSGLRPEVVSSGHALTVRSERSRPLVASPAKMIFLGSARGGDRREQAVEQTVRVPQDPKPARHHRGRSRVHRVDGSPAREPDADLDDEPVRAPEPALLDRPELRGAHQRGTLAEGRE